MNHRKLATVCALALALTTALSSSAFAAEGPSYTRYPSYPTAVTRSEDGTEIRKMYDLGPEDDPGGIPRSDFEQDGYHYTLTDLLKQELPAPIPVLPTRTRSTSPRLSATAAVRLPSRLSTGRPRRMDILPPSPLIPAVLPAPM